MIRNPRIAILGATSHIAKSLIYYFLKGGQQRLSLYARSKEKMNSFLRCMGVSAEKACAVYDNYDDLCAHSYDVLINCVGVGTYKALQGDYTKFFTVTEEFDNRAIGYLEHKNPRALFINLSSGAVYGNGFSAPIKEGSCNCIKVNNVSREDYYGIVRINAEAKHRAHKKLRIVDLRVFSYFSTFIDLNDGYFITDVLRAIGRNTVLRVDGNSLVRDYLHPEDLFQAVVKCIFARKINCAFDITSAAPVSKWEILDYFADTYGLKYKVQKRRTLSATGAKSIYYSTVKRASQIGYKPKYSSIECIQTVSKEMLFFQKNGKWGLKSNAQRCGT